MRQDGPGVDSLPGYDENTTASEPQEVVTRNKAGHECEQEEVVLVYIVTAKHGVAYRNEPVMDSRLNAVEGPDHGNIVIARGAAANTC